MEALNDSRDVDPDEGNGEEHGDQPHPNRGFACSLLESDQFLDCAIEHNADDDVRNHDNPEASTVCPPVEGEQDLLDGHGSPPKHSCHCLRRLIMSAAQRQMAMSAIILEPSACPNFYRGGVVVVLFAIQVAGSIRAQETQGLSIELELAKKWT